MHECLIACSNNQNKQFIYRLSSNINSLKSSLQITLSLTFLLISEAEVVVYGLKELNAAYCDS